MIDRIRISYKIKFNERLHIEGILKKIGSTRVVDKVTGLKLYFFNDMNDNFKIELLCQFNILFVEFNPCKLDNLALNVGTFTLKQIKKGINFTQKKVELKLQMNLPEFYTWRINKIEIRNDYIMNSSYEKKLLLESLKKDDGGHFKRFNTGNLGSYWYQRDMAIKIYDKKEEINKHILSRGKIIKFFPSDITTDKIEKMIRIEVEIRYSKLKNILNSLSNSPKLDITLEDILNPYILTSLFNNVLDNFNLGMPIRSLEKTLKIIQAKVKTKNMMDKLSKFVKCVNSTCVQVAKNKYGSLFYSYRNKLKAIGVNMLCINAYTNLTFEILKEFNHLSKDFLVKFINFFDINIPNNYMNNIQQLFLIFKSLKFKIRI